MKEAAYAAVLAWKNALNVDDHEQKELARTTASTGRGTTRQQARADADPRVPEEDDRRLRHLHEVRARRARAPVTIKYRKARIFYEYNHFDEAAPLFQDIVQKHPKHELAIYSANLLLDSLNAQGKTKEVVAWARQVPRDAGADEGPRVRQADDLAEERHLRHGGARVREARQLQGVRPVVAGRRRGAARPPQARRAALERRPVLPERAPRRPGAQGAGRAHQGAPERRAGAEGALPRRRPATTSSPTTRRRREYYEDFAKQFPGEKKAPTRSATRRRSASASASARRRSPTWTRS